MFPPFSDTINTIFEEFEMIRNQISIFRKKYWNLDVKIIYFLIYFFKSKKHTIIVKILEMTNVQRTVLVLIYY